MIWDSGVPVQKFLNQIFTLQLDWTCATLELRLAKKGFSSFSSEASLSETLVVRSRFHWSACIFSRLWPDVAHMIQCSMILIAITFLTSKVHRTLSRVSIFRYCFRTLCWQLKHCTTDWVLMAKWKKRKARGFGKDSTRSAQLPNLFWILPTNVRS